MQARVFVCDDHPIIHMGVAACLRRDTDIAVVGGGSWSDSTMVSLAASSPDVIIFDLDQAKDGKADLRRLNSICPRAKLLIFTGTSHLDEMVHALEAGASGLITKSGDTEHVLSAVQRLIRGDNYLEPGVAMQLIDALRNAENRRSELSLLRLSFREEQVLKCLLKGNTNGQIAEHLSISEKTVKYYIGCLKDKFNAANRLEIVLTAQRYAFA